MIEIIIIFSLVNMVFSLVNIVQCIWNHDTNMLLGWCCSFLGWFVAFCQVIQRIQKGE